MTQQSESKPFHEISYDLHEKIYANAPHHDLEAYKNWFDKGTVDVWRHLRMLSVLDPFLEKDSGASWLCVADGRYGSSSIYINRKGGKALPTDIDDTLLKVALEEGMISDCRKENAEKLSFADKSFDYVFCKEAYHHFPRPYLALYEMIRTARKAVILVEPRDWIPSPMTRKILQKLKYLVYSLLGRALPHPDTGNYEPVGNYVYTLSERELQKASAALGLHSLALQEMHNVYFPGSETELLSAKGPIWKKIQSELSKQNWMAALGLRPMNYLKAVIFLHAPPEEVLESFRKAGFRCQVLPVNPYVKA